MASRCRSLRLLLAVGLFVALPQWAGAQTPPTQGAVGQSGVVIDASGVLRRNFVADPTGELTRRRLTEARSELDQDVAAQSKLRKISLNRLEAALAERTSDGRKPTAAMKYLAGLTRVKYVFYYPETKDIVIAGPAEGWGEDLSGRVVGLNTGRPVVELEDLVVALRAFGPNGRNPGEVFCSIDPTPEGLTRLNRFIGELQSSLRSPPGPAEVEQMAAGMQNNLGMQKISVGGVSPKTHFAQVLVEADYRMKLIGIGLERPPVKLTSYVARANPAAVARNAMQRWYFMPDYQCVRVAEDGQAMELVGEGVKLVGEDEVVGADGSRKSAGTGNKASAEFVANFTKVYPELAAREPIYAQLRNCIDLLVAAAFMQKQDLYGAAGWKMTTFASEKAFAVETGNAPQQVESAVNALWKGNRLMTPIGGGVTISATRALESEMLLEDEDGRVGKLRQEIDLSSLPADQWWWD